MYNECERKYAQKSCNLKSTAAVLSCPMSSSSTSGKGLGMCIALWFEDLECSVSFSTSRTSSCMARKITRNNQVAWKHRCSSGTRISVRTWPQDDFLSF